MDREVRKERVSMERVGTGGEYDQNTLCGILKDLVKIFLSVGAKDSSQVQNPLDSWLWKVW